MKEEVIIENILGDISNITEEEKNIKSKIIVAVVENEKLKMALSSVQKDISKYPVVKYPLASKVVRPGMHVNFDAGKWDRTVGVPSYNAVLPWKRYGFCMFDKEKSKNDSVMDYYGNLSPCGWLVLGVIDNLVYLIHAGIACVYYPNYRGNAATEIKHMREFCAKEFANSPYAKEALCATKQLFEIVEKSLGGFLPEELTSVGASYWLATTTKHNTIGFYHKTKGGYEIDIELGPREVNGIRPVVILKENTIVVGGNGTKDEPIELSI